MKFIYKAITIMTMSVASMLLYRYKKRKRENSELQGRTDAGVGAGSGSVGGGSVGGNGGGAVNGGFGAGNGGFGGGFRIPGAPGGPGGPGGPEGPGGPGGFGHMFGKNWTEWRNTTDQSFDQQDHDHQEYEHITVNNQNLDKEINDTIDAMESGNERVKRVKRTRDKALGMRQVYSPDLNHVQKNLKLGNLRSIAFNMSSSPLEQEKPTNGTLTKHQSKGKLEKKSSEAGTSSSLSRDSSFDKGPYTDSTGLDLKEFIHEALNKSQKDRSMLLKLQTDINNFINEPEHHYLKFPQMSSYDRMLIHRIAVFFGLDHTVDQTGKCVIVSKTSKTHIPDFSFRDHIESAKPGYLKKPKLVLKSDEVDEDFIEKEETQSNQPDGSPIQASSLSKNSEGNQLGSNTDSSPYGTDERTYHSFNCSINSLLDLLDEPHFSLSSSLCNSIQDSSLESWKEISFSDSSIEGSLEGETEIEEDNTKENKRMIIKPDYSNLLGDSFEIDESFSTDMAIHRRRTVKPISGFKWT